MTDTINPTFEELVEIYWSWAQDAFDTEAIASLSGLKREVEELQDEMLKENPGYPEIIEFADIAFYFIYCLRRRGWNIDTLKHAMETKLLILKKREWAKNADGTYSHVKNHDL